MHAVTTTGERVDIGQGRSRRQGSAFRLAGAMLLVLCVVAVAGCVGTAANNGERAWHDRDKDHGAVKAVQAYLDAIARGDATAANAMVDPKVHAQDVDLALLSDDVLAVATEHITPHVVFLDRSTDVDADTVEVNFRYRLPGVLERSGLDVVRVKRDDSENWRVIDPVLMKVAVQTNVPGMSKATIGSVHVPITPLALTTDAQIHYAYLYPAVYPVVGGKSRYLTAGPVSLVPHENGNVALVDIDYEPTSRLRKELSTQVADHVRGCIAAGVRMPRTCPHGLSSRAQLTDGEVSVTKRPTIGEIDTSAADAKSPPDSPRLDFVASVEIAWDHDYAGKAGSEQLNVRGQVTIMPSDTITVAFTS